MLTENQKVEIAAIAAARDAAFAAKEARLAAETAARREENRIYWQPVLAAARDALPAWLTDGASLEPDSLEDDLAERWVKLAQKGQLYTDFTTAVTLYDASSDHILTITMRRTATAWTPETYHVIDGADYGRYNYNSLELALLRLPAEDEKRQETRAAQDKVAAPEDDGTTYAAYKAQEAARAAEIKAAQEAEAARRAQFESELSALMTAAEQCLVRAAENSNHPSVASLHLSFSLTQSATAIARILNDWRLTAREYAERPF